MSYPTADLYDRYEGHVEVLDPILRDFGGLARFSGPIATLQVLDDNTLVRKALESPGRARVLVVHGGGSLTCALVGDKIAELAQKNGWSGLVVNGCIRDAAVIREMAIGVKAIATNPRKSVKRDSGVADVPVRFGGVTFVPGHHLYADEDGVLVSADPLTLEV